VTFDATASHSHAREGANPVLTAALAVTAIAAATLAGAWFFQLVLDLRPCPLCLEQRYAYYLAIPLGALVAFAAAKDAPRGGLLAGLGQAREHHGRESETTCENCHVCVGPCEPVQRGKHTIAAQSPRLQSDASP